MTPAVAREPRRFWSDSDLTTLKRLYPDQLNRDIAAALRRSVAAVYGMAAHWGIKKSREFLASDKSGGFHKGHTRGRATQFKKGIVPANKGLRRPGWSVGRMRETQFKKGQRSRNWKPVGTILADSDGYMRIKVREKLAGEASGFGNSKIWPQLSRVIWEQQKGPIPPGHVVIFKDRNRANCAIENLEMLSKADNCRRNSMWSVLPRDLAEVVYLNGALKRRIRRLSGEEHDRRSA